MSTTLVLSPESYPWEVGKEQTFLEPELPSLVQAFDRVVLVPQQLGGARAELPAGLEVDDSYAREVAALSRAQLMRHAVASGLLLEDLASRPRETLHRVTMKRLLAFAGRAEHARDWALRFSRAVKHERIIFYTYWWGATTAGFGLARRADARLKVVTRAHGFDLYEDRHTPPWLPCRKSAVALLDGLFPDSDTGTRYVTERFGRALPRTETVRLGVPDPGVRCEASRDGVLRVVSCSVQVPVKRLELLIDGLAHAGRERPAQRIEWTHFGTGPLQPQLEAQGRRVFPENVKAHFAGYSTQRELFAWYGAHAVDVFVNVSSSEGTPVAIMEALACGIPILATAVGGNPEVASEKNGGLLTANPSPAELGARLLEFVGASGERRAASRALWQERYAAETNARSFSRTLREL